VVSLPSKIDAIRWKIEETDNEIMGLIGQRMRLALEMGKVKVGKDVPVRNLRVEVQVMDRYKAMAREALVSEAAAQEIASILLKESVEAQILLPRTQPAMRITVVGGAGRMGGWFARFFRDRGHKVIIHDLVKTDGFEFQTDLKAAVADADFILIATPISASGKMMERIAALSPKGIVFDIASIKSRVIPVLRKVPQRKVRVCSIHPMFGPDVRSLLDRNLIVCDCGDPAVTDEVAALFDGSGAKVTRIPVETHDHLMAYVLGLSHAVNIAFFDGLSRTGIDYPTFEQVASTTFAKQACTSRAVANENPDLYYEIQHLNAHTPETFRRLAEAVKQLEEAAQAEDKDRFTGIMNKGRAYFGGK
jgi:chorismate mutase/prephenate dehydrogenase